YARDAHARQPPRCDPSRARPTPPREPALLLLPPSDPAQPVEHHRLGHAQEANRGVRARFARAHRDVGPVRPEYLDDRADVADLAVLAVAPFERLHLRR